MKIIKGQTGADILVDDRDFNFLSQYKWQTSSGYAIAWMFGKFRYMHVFLCPHQTGQVTDHRDRNKLNNQRKNLRAVIRSIDMFNRGMFKNNELKVTGVRRRKDNGKYTAQISIGGKPFHLGTFNNLSQAKSAYQKAKSKVLPQI